MKIIDRHRTGPLAGFVRAFLMDPVTRQISHVCEKHNLVVYRGMDLVGRLIAGVGSPINTMYMAFENVAPGAVTPPSFDASSTAADFLGLSGGQDFIRMALQVSPGLSQTGADYSTNQVTFYALSTGTTGLANGVAFGTGSSVFGAGLIAAQDEGDVSQDILYSRVDLSTPIQKAAGKLIGIQWTIYFTLT